MKKQRKPRADLQCDYGHSADTANLLKTLDIAKSLFLLARSE